jgi:hypothetical protein
MHRDETGPQSTVNEVTTGRAVLKEHGNWLFQGVLPLPPLEEVVITVAAKDKMGNVTRGVLEAGKELVCFHDWRGAPHLNE